MSVQRVLVFQCKVEVESRDCTSAFFYCDMFLKLRSCFLHLPTYFKNSIVFAREDWLTSICSYLELLCANMISLIYKLILIFGLVCTSITLLVLACTFEPRHEISNNVVCATSKGSDQPAHMRSLIRALLVA